MAPALRLAVLGSGSEGNAVVVRAGSTAVLVDAGFPRDTLAERLAAIGENLEALTAILLTHEHGDHARAAGSLARGLGIPVYLTRGTFEALGERLRQGDGRVAPGTAFIRPGSAFSVGALTIEPFAVPHDAADPVAYCLSMGGLRVGICTDLGCVTYLTLERLKGCRLLVLEANHDARLLTDGAYHAGLKRRIAGRHGHLSNEEMGRILEAVAPTGVSHVVLAHLSRENNRPELALAAAEAALARADRRDVRLVVASQDVPTALVPG